MLLDLGGASYASAHGIRFEILSFFNSASATAPYPHLKRYRGKWRRMALKKFNTFLTSFRVAQILQV